MRHISLSSAEARALLGDVRAEEARGGEAGAVPAYEDVPEDQMLASQLALLARQVERLRVAGSRPSRAAAASTVEAAEAGLVARSEEEDATHADNHDDEDEALLESDESDGGSEDDREASQDRKAGLTGPGGDVEDGAEIVQQQQQQVGPMLELSTSSGKRFSLYKAILPRTEAQPALLRALPGVGAGIWVFLMLRGGHFAGAVFRNGQPIVHKCFHRYVIRAKRGTIQSSRDKTGNKPKSAGAQIRRHNEAMLHQDIHDIMTTWRAHLQAAELIFVQTAAVMRSVFFGAKGEDTGLDRADVRVRSVPFETRRPTLGEVTRAYTRLFALFVHEDDESGDGGGAGGSVGKKEEERKNGMEREGRGRIR